MILVLIFDVVHVDSELHIQHVQRGTKTIRRFDAFIYGLFVFALFFLFVRVRCRITLPFAVSAASHYRNLESPATHVLVQCTLHFRGDGLSTS